MAKEFFTRAPLKAVNELVDWWINREKDITGQEGYFDEITDGDLIAQATKELLEEVSKAGEKRDVLMEWASRSIKKDGTSISMNASSSSRARMSHEFDKFVATRVDEIKKSKERGPEEKFSAEEIKFMNQFLESQLTPNPADHDSAVRNGII